jgi:hypothetical protein
MGNTITIKRGDTLLIDGVYKQSNGAPMNLEGYTLECNVINSSDRSVVTVVTGISTPSRVLTITEPTAGKFTLVVKDTEVLRDEDYFIDFKATTISSNYEQTSKAIRLKVKAKLV